MQAHEARQQNINRNMFSRLLFCLVSQFNTALVRILAVRIIHPTQIKYNSPEGASTAGTSQRIPGSDLLSGTIQ